MANLSSAFGTIRMEAENEETLANLVSFIKKSGEWQYGDYGLVLEDELTQMKGAVSGTFTGCGRWTFSNTLSYMMENIKRYLSATDELVLALEKEDFTITIEYTDSESGCLVLYQEEDVIIHKAGTLLEDSDFTICSEENYSWTWANRIALDTEDLESILECYYDNIISHDSSKWDREDVESFVNDLESELPELIEELNHKSKDDFFKQNVWLEDLFLTAKAML